MKFIKVALASLLFVSTVACSQNRNVLEHVHASTYHIEQETTVEQRICSATAIAPHALLTDTHCELGSDILNIEGIDEPIQILSRIRDKNDHTIFIVNASFSDYIPITLNPNFYQGQEIFIFGNPGQFSDVFRKGTISGTNTGLNTPNQILVDINVYSGDSGSGVFTDDGELVLTINEVGVLKSDEDMSFKIEASFPITFDQKDLDALYK